jgi:surfactin synthase thioesterase subunit
VSARYGGIPAAVLAEPELLALLLPTLRADLRIVEDYRYREGPALACPVLACGGADDAEAPPATVAAWRAYTRGAFRAESFPGGHFYWQADVPRFCREIAGELQRWGVLPGAA